MKKEIQKEFIAEPVVHHDENTDATPFAEAAMSEELKKAIQSLIYRMRERGPIQNT